jgi:hypothetical protein
LNSGGGSYTFTISTSSFISSSDSTYTTCPLSSCILRRGSYTYPYSVSDLTLTKVSNT